MHKRKLIGCQEREREREREDFNISCPKADNKLKKKKSVAFVTGLTVFTTLMGMDYEILILFACLSEDVARFIWCTALFTSGTRGKIIAFHTNVTVTAVNRFPTWIFLFGKCLCETLYSLCGLSKKRP